jgi:hypothetical protein
MNQYAQPGQGHGAAQYMPRGLPMTHHVGDNTMHNLVSSMGSMNLHSSYGSNGTTKSATSVMSANSSDYGGMPITQGQGLWVPNQTVMPSVYQVMPGGAQQQGQSPGVYSQAGSFVPGAHYQYNQAMVDNSPMAPGWTSRVSSGHAIPDDAPP